MFRPKRFKGVKVTIFTSEHFKKGVPKHLISPTDIATFNEQYPKLTVRYNESFHDRFLIIDDKELYVIGASLKDLGRKCFRLRRVATADRLRSPSWTRAKSTTQKSAFASGARAKNMV